MSDLRTLLPLDLDAEITMEANPGTFEAEKFKAFRASGINRLSIGIQSFDSRHLQALGRIHDAGEAVKAVEIAQANFDNFNLDLMYALPGQTLAEAQADIDMALGFAPPHLSLYHLTMEPNTVFAKYPPVLPSDDESADIQDMIAERTAAAGYDHYEVSAYAKPGHRARHNLNYWRGGDYLACGCGAHGHRAGHRWWNERSTPRYIEMMRTTGSARVGEETLSAQDRLTEIVMLGLRLREGFSLDDTSRRLDLDARRELNGQLRNLQATGILTEENGRIRLAPESVLVADAVAAQLIMRHS